MKRKLIMISRFRNATYVQMILERSLLFGLTTIGFTKRVPDNLLNDEGKRIAKLSGRRIFSLLIGTALSYIGLLLYLQIAPLPNLTLIEVWLVGTAVVLPLGITLINIHLNRTLLRHQVADDVNDRTT